MMPNTQTLDEAVQERLRRWDGVQIALDTKDELDQRILQAHTELVEEFIHDWLKQRCHVALDDDVRIVVEQRIKPNHYFVRIYPPGHSRDYVAINKLVRVTGTHSSADFSDVSFMVALGTVFFAKNLYETYNTNDFVEAMIFATTRRIPPREDLRP